MSEPTRLHVPIDPEVISNDEYVAGSWMMSYFDDDGGIYTALFEGPLAEQRAQDYYHAIQHKRINNRIAEAFEGGPTKVGPWPCTPADARSASIVSWSVPAGGHEAEANEADEEPDDEDDGGAVESIEIIAIEYHFRGGLNETHPIEPDDGRTSSVSTPGISSPTRARAWYESSRSCAAPTVRAEFNPDPRAVPCSSGAAAAPRSSYADTRPRPAAAA
jgi:hypothetical protein